MSQIVARFRSYTIWFTGILLSIEVIRPKIHKRYVNVLTNFIRFVDNFFTKRSRVMEILTHLLQYYILVFLSAISQLYCLPSSKVARAMQRLQLALCENVYSLCICRHM
jgi:hypothetical protein